MMDFRAHTHKDIIINHSMQKKNEDTNKKKI